MPNVAIKTRPGNSRPALRVVDPDAALHALVKKFEAARAVQKSADTALARNGSGPSATDEETAAHKNWERMLDRQDKTARRVIACSAHTLAGALLKIRVAGSLFTMPPIKKGDPRFSDGIEIYDHFEDFGGDKDEHILIKSIRADLRKLQGGV